MLANHLQPNLSKDNFESAPTRHGYGEGLLEAGRRDERVVALCCDLTESTRTHQFAEAFPKRFVQIGIAEQNMASVASGMSAMGKVPFMASYAIFSPGRNWEQIRTTIAYNNSNVKIVGAHAGVSVGPDGATHQATEDMAIMRAIPNMVVIAPADVHEARKVTLAVAKYDGPVYFRLGRSATPVVTTAESPFTIGKGEQLYFRDPALERKIGLVVTGTLLFNALMAAEELRQVGIGASVLHLPTIKPLDTELLEAFAVEHEQLVTIEEHQIIGGLGSAVAEYLSEVRPTRVTRMGIKDRFGESGESDQLISFFGLDTPAIVAEVRRLLG